MPDDEQQPEITDDQRGRTVDRLQGHVGRGDLTLAEFEDRVQRALAAQNSGELERVTDGLPAEGTPRPTRRPARRWLVSVFGGSTTRGRWRVASRLRTVSVFGGSDIDLRGAEIDGEEITIVATAICGGDTIYLPDSVDVELSGGALLGGNDLHGSAHRPRPGAPLVRVRAYSLMGGVEVYRVPPEGAALSLRDTRRLVKGEQPRHRELQ